MTEQEILKLAEALDDAIGCQCDYCPASEICGMEDIPCSKEMAKWIKEVVADAE